MGVNKMRAMICAIAAGVAIGVSGSVHGGISYSTPGSLYSENFDGLPTGTANGKAIQYNATAHIQNSNAPFPGGWKDDTVTDATYLSLAGWHLYHQAVVGTDTGNGYYDTGGANG